MQSYRVIAFAVLMTMAWTIRASGAVPSSHDVPVPSQWHVGSTWAVLVFAPNHRLVGSMVVRFTREKADSCINGDWKRIEVLRRQFKDPGFLATKPLSYSLEGNKLALGVTEVCDAYIFLRGILTDEGLSGDYGTFGLDGFHKLGYFGATIVKN